MSRRHRVEQACTRIAMPANLGGGSSSCLLFLGFECAGYFQAKAKPAAAPITALAWNGSGSALAFGAEDGEAGVIDPG
jgi:hypothetical protein